MSAPIRTCVGCREVAEQDQLVRFVLVDGQVEVDPDGIRPGRGAWLHARRECLEAAGKRGGFARSFRRAADAGVLLEAHWPDGASAR